MGLAGIVKGLGGEIAVSEMICSGYNEDEGWFCKVCLSVTFGFVAAKDWVFGGVAPAGGTVAAGYYGGRVETGCTEWEGAFGGVGLDIGVTASYQKAKRGTGHTVNIGRIGPTAGIGGSTYTGDSCQFCGGIKSKVKVKDRLKSKAKEKIKELQKKSEKG